MAKKKLPKKIGGFRVPKGVRKSRVLQSLLRNQLGREILAGAITAGAGAAAAVLVEERKELKKAGKKGLRKGRGVAALASRALSSAASAAIGVVTDRAHILSEKTPKGKERYAN